MMRRDLPGVALANRSDWFRLGPHLLAPYLDAVERGVHGSDGDLPLSGSRPFARWYESLVRPMSLGAPMLAGADGPVWIELPGGRRIDLAVWYRTKLMEGAATWTPAARGMDQTIVETSLLAICLHVARAQLWDPLPDETKRGLADWMHAVSHQLSVDINNWDLFPIMTQLGLRNLGMPHDQDFVDELLASVEKFHHTDGWYADGYYRQFDYYVPEAIYLLIMAAAWSGPGEFRDRIFARAASFAQDFALFFDAEGRNIGYGRSRSYKFSASFFFAMCAWAGVPEVAPGLCRVIVARNIGWYLRQPLFASDGRLLGGFGYANERVDEVYIGPSSCAWAFQSFLPMALPATHPFWTDPAPERPRAIQRYMSAPKYMVTFDDTGRNATLYNGGSHHPFDYGGHAAKYGKFAYSSHFGINLADAVSASFDHMICLRVPGGEVWSHRHRFEILPDQGAWLVSRHQPFESDPETVITTAMRVGGSWCVRVHLMQLAHSYEVREGGTPVQPMPGRDAEDPVAEQGNGWIVLRGANGVAGGWCLHGALTPGMTDHVNTNLLHRRVWAPVLECARGPGRHLLATAWWAEVDPNIAVSRPPNVSVDDQRCMIVWPDGTAEKITLPRWDGSALNISSGGGFARGRTSAP
jgi:hypothetical protein